MVSPLLDRKGATVRNTNEAYPSPMGCFQSCRRPSAGQSVRTGPSSYRPSRRGPRKSGQYPSCGSTADASGGEGSLGVSTTVAPTRLDSASVTPSAAPLSTAAGGACGRAADSSSARCRARSPPARRSRARSTGSVGSSHCRRRSLEDRARDRRPPPRAPPGRSRAPSS